MLSILAQDSQQGGSSLVAFLPLILMGGVFYFLLIRPQQRRAKAQQALVRSVEVGDEVVTTSGILGTIVGVDEDEDVLTVEIAPGTQIRMVRAGVARRLTEDDVDDMDYDEEDDDDMPGGGGPDDQQGPIQKL
jgi:preprotein translocase subunit YajC